MYNSRIPAERVFLRCSLCLAIVAAGCQASGSKSHGNAGGASSDAAAADTIRGTLQRVGNEPVSVLVLSSTTTENAVFALVGKFGDELARGVGLEVMISGVRTDNRDFSASPRGATVFEVAQYFVRSADGQPAVDGVLGVSNGKYFLISTAGRRIELPTVPEELRLQVGSRVFLVGSLQKGPAAYGILAPKK